MGFESLAQTPRPNAALVAPPEVCLRCRTRDALTFHCRRAPRIVAGRRFSCGGRVLSGKLRHETTAVWQSPVPLLVLIGEQDV